MKKEQVIIYTSSKEATQAVASTFERAASLLTFCGEFMAFGTELDENQEEIVLKENLAPALEKFVQSLILAYPSPELLRRDIENLTNFRLSVEKPNQPNITGASSRRGEGH